MIEKIKCSTDEEWRELRKKGIGGSDAGAIIGMNPWKSAFTLWAEKTGVLEPEDISDKEAVRLGNYLEDYVAKRFEEETGKEVRRVNFTLKNSDYPFAHANIDRALVGCKEGLECKTTSEMNLKKFNGQEFPEMYYAQCVHYLAVTGWDRWHLAVLIGNREVRIYTLERDQAEIDALMSAEMSFWGRVQSGNPPAVDGSASTTETIKQLYPADPEVPEIDVTMMETSIKLYAQAKERIKTAERDAQFFQNQIVQFMGNATKGSNDRWKVSYPEVETKRFDKKAFERAYPNIDLGPFHTVTKSRRFTVKEI